MNASFSVPQPSWRSSARLAGTACFALAKRCPIIVPLALAAALMMLLVSEGSYRQSVAALNEMEAMGAARASIQGLQWSILDAETGERGRLAVGREGQLQAHDKTLREIGEAFEFLRAYYGEEPKSFALLKKLRALTETKLSDVAAAATLREGDRGKSTPKVVLSDIDRELIHAIRAISDELLEYETLNVAASRRALHQHLLLSRIGMAALSAISLLALFMYLRQTFALKKQQQEQRNLLQTGHDQLEVEAGLRTAQLKQLTHHLQTAREDERSRLARDLHDELGALLTSAKLDAARIKSRLGGTAPEVLERLVHLGQMLDGGIALKRRIIEDLRPSALNHLGLVATLEILAREFAEQSGAQVHHALEPVELAASAELMLFRVVQEAITNVAKYARAKNVWVTLAAVDGQARLSVRDDGVGFDTRAQPVSAYGLLGMRYRVEAEGGTLAVVSAPGQGALIQVKLPEATARSPTPAGAGGRWAQAVVVPIVA
ncbi:MAG TPA: ATP-binding protein [Burkholderiaceae bacterium]|nr:ATP-binding protein [Burkholderiaceae bacterium]